MDPKPSSDVAWRLLTHEERTRHEILFYNQGPVDGVLPGDHARALFLRSNLPLHVLSQIWNLVDQPQDNFLDAGEFAVAMHLLQQTLRGVPLPKEALPACLTPGAGGRKEARVPTMLKRECVAYRRLFYALDERKRGKLKAEVVREILSTAEVSRGDLARVWDVSDADRDGQLSVDEFCVACHLTRHTKKGRVNLSGPVNILSILPHRQSQTDLATKKAKMAELEERKKNLMALRVKKKTEASQESERAKIWRERLEILKRRHQALTDDPIDFSEVVLKEEARQLERVETVVKETEAISVRLDGEQKDIRRETARVIMEAEKLAQEVNKLQEEVRRLRETRRRTSQLKDLDPFHQLFEQQKEESLTGIHSPKKEYDIRIPFVHDPFDLSHLDPPPLSGEELFQCSLSEGDKTSHGVGAQSDHTPDPWTPAGARPEMQELTLGFEDSFLEMWGREQAGNHDRNRNIVPEVQGDVSDFRLSGDGDDLIFKTVSVTEEEDDLWSSLPISHLEEKSEALKCLHSIWNSTTDKLQQLHDDIQKTLTNAQPGRRISPTSLSSEDPTPTPPIGFRDVPESFANLTAPAPKVAGQPNTAEVQVICAPKVAGQPNTAEVQVICAPKVAEQPNTTEVQVICAPKVTEQPNTTEVQVICAPKVAEQPNTTEVQVICAPKVAEQPNTTEVQVICAPKVAEQPNTAEVQVICVPQSQVDSQNFPHPPTIVIEDTDKVAASEDSVGLDVLAIEQSVLDDSPGSPGGPSEVLVEESLIPAEFRGECSSDTKTSSDTKSSLDLKLSDHRSHADDSQVEDKQEKISAKEANVDIEDPAAPVLIQSDSQSLLAEIKHVLASSRSENTSEHFLLDSESDKQSKDCGLESLKTNDTEQELGLESQTPDRATSDTNIAESSANGRTQEKASEKQEYSKSISVATSDGGDHKLPTQTSTVESFTSCVPESKLLTSTLNAEPQKEDITPSAEKTPPLVPSRRKKSVPKSPSELSSGVQPSIPSASSSPFVLPRSRSLKKKYPAPKPPTKEPDPKHILRKQLNFDDSQIVGQSEETRDKDLNVLRRTASVPVKCRNSEDSPRHVSAKQQANGIPVIKSSSEPPRPPPRLKKKLRLSQSFQSSNPLDLTRVPRSKSLPENDSVYENVTFPPGDAVIAEEPEKQRLPAVENISVLHINGNGEAFDGHITEQVKVEQEQSVQNIHINLDDIIPDNPESVVGHFEPASDNLYVNVIDISENALPKETTIHQSCVGPENISEQGKISDKEGNLDIVDGKEEKLPNEKEVIEPPEEPLVVQEQENISEKDHILDIVSGQEEKLGESVNDNISEQDTDISADDVKEYIINEDVIEESPSLCVNVIDVIAPNLDEGKVSDPQESKPVDSHVQITGKDNYSDEHIYTNAEILPEEDDLRYSPEEINVSVINVQHSSPFLNEDKVSDVEVDNQDEMDASARKQELENLRSQFFGKKSYDSSAENAATESTTSTVTISSTVVSVQDFSPPQSSDPEPVTNAQFITVTDVQRTPSPDRSTSPSLYEIVRSKTENVNNNVVISSQKTPGRLDQKSSAKIILDLDDHQTKRELEPVLDTSIAPQTSRIALDLDDHQGQHEFTPEQPKLQSKIVLDLDDFSSRAELDSGFSSNNNTLSSAPPDLLDSCQTSRMLLDLDEVQAVPNSVGANVDEQSNLLVDIGGPDGFPNEPAIHGSVTDPDTSELSTPETPTSPYYGWNRLDDSDVSDDEQNFSATFTPGAPIDAPDDFAENDNEQYEDSGIVLVSYQQKPKDPDFLDLTLQVASSEQSCAPVEPDQVSNRQDSTPVSASHVFYPFDPFDPFAVQSKVENSSLMAQDLKDISTDAPATNTDSGLLMGDLNMPEPPADFSSTSYLDNHDVPSRELDHNIYGDNNLDLGRPSAGESADNMRNNWSEYDGTRPRAIGHDLNDGKLLMASATSASIDPWRGEEENFVNDFPGVTVSKSPVSWDDSRQAPDLVEDLLTERSNDSRPESSASRDNLRLDLSPTPELSHSPEPESDMDPVTGLRRTTPLSPMEKALRFVGSTELTYKVKKVGPGAEEELVSPEQAALSLELQQERNEIMGAMRVKKKRLNSWMQDSVDAGKVKVKSDSERKYEQRKKKLDGSEERDEIDFANVPAPHWSAVILSPNHAEGEPERNQEPAHEPWESDPLSPSLQKLPDHDVNDNNNIYASESAIEREIREAREREEQLKSDRSETNMPIHKIPELALVEKGSVKSVAITSPKLPMSPPPSAPTATMYKELPEVDRDSAIIKRESIIEREIREQQERERALREEGYLRSSQHVNKEEEQSEFERQEKEHERVLAHESIVAREIREQQERERELISLRQSTSSFPEHDPAFSPTPANTVTMTTAYTNSNEPEVNHTTVTVTTTTVTHVEPEPSITYEEAIKTKSHDGESIITRELREQREREDELRTHYKQMGLGDFLADQEPSDTPFNRPEPTQPDLTKLSARAKSTLKPLGKMTKSVSEPVQLGGFSGVKADIVVVGKVTTSASQDAINASSKPESILEEPTTSPRDDLDGFDHSYRFTPQNETPIEREMRFVRDREEELRQVRGIPKATKNPDDIVEIKDITVSAYKPQVSYKKGDEGDGKFLQKLASGRLQFEMEREKRREQDLKSQGMISTMSEERIGPATRYVDVIPREPAKQTPNWKLQTQTSTTSVQRAASPGAASTASSSDAVDSQTDVHPNGPTPSKTEPAITHRYASQTRPEGGARERATPTMAESRIEVELREMREREEELRSVRRSFTEFGAQDSGTSVAPSSQKQPTNGYETHGRSQSTSSDSVKTGRRKSALAEEWEKKFGAN